MSDNVIPLFGEVLHDQPAGEFLKLVADSMDLETVLVVGETEDGEVYLGGNIGSFEKMVHLMFRANHQMQKIEAHFPTYGEYDE